MANGYRPTFVSPYRLRNGPADDYTDEEEPIHPSYKRTPFPHAVPLGSPTYNDDYDSDVVVPGRPRSISDPERYGSMQFGQPMSAGFGSPTGISERGPHSPPHPHIMPGRSALRHARRPTIDNFGSPPQNSMGLQPGAYPFPQAGPRAGYTPNAFPYRQVPTPMMAPQQLIQSPMFYPQQQQPMQMPPLTGNVPMPIYGMPPASSAGMRTPMPMHMPQMQQMPPPPPSSGTWGPPSHHHGRRQRRRPSSDDEEEEEEGIVPPMRSAPPMSGGRNPIPQPPRLIPAPRVSPEGSVLVDSPPMPPPAREKPLPNPIPVPPKQLHHSSGTTPELEAAAAEVKRARERTELARDKAIARLEAETWAAAGLPVAGTVEEPALPLVPGVTVPGLFPKAAPKREDTVRRKEVPRKEVREVTEMQMHNEGTGHNPLGSLLKRLSTKHRPSASEPPPLAPKPPKRESNLSSMRPPPMPHHNSGDIPREEGIRPRSSKRATINPPYATPIGPVVNGHQFLYPHDHHSQEQMQFHPESGEYFDRSNGLWWNPHTRQYYQKNSATIAPLGKGHERKESGGKLFSMIKRWTTNTAPDDQPKPITAQLVLPREPGNTDGLKGMKALGTVPPLRTEDQRRSHQAQSLYHPRNRRRTASMGATARPVEFNPGTVNGRHPGASTRGVSRVPAANVYFSRLKEQYGPFRLDSNYTVTWAGITALTALNWFESGKFERSGMGLGSPGLGTGGTFPSRMPSTRQGGGGGSKFLKGLLGKNDENVKRAKQEYSMARTEESEDILRIPDTREIQRAGTEFIMAGRERNDWNAIWKLRLDEILYLRFQQHEGLLGLLLETGEAQIIFADHDHVLGDGGNVNGRSGNGANELGQSLMRVRHIFRQQYGLGEFE